MKTKQQQWRGGELKAMATARKSHCDIVLDTVASGHAAAHSSVAASWCRSALHHGLDPGNERRNDRLEAEALARLREANGELLAAAKPTLDRLYGNVGAVGACVIISDLDGVVLEARSNPSEEALFTEVGLVAGAMWSEQAEGTNGIGTCLVEGRPITIQQHEHFASRNVGVSCMDAPIFDPTGKLVAALDVSSARNDQGEAISGMIGALVQDAARTIERDFFCRRYATARIVYVGADHRLQGASQGMGQGMTQGAALLAVDRDDLVIGATRVARRQLGLAVRGALQPMPLAHVLGEEGAQAGFDDAERAVLRQALARSGGNVAAAARLLGIGRATFYRRMERVGMTGAGLQ
ncbi:GAF domain-containing protein [Novosphingobium nitrogenifigens]|nr:GAF domain-containing protein [Novosphingobium nitrogenifigens]